MRAELIYLLEKFPGFKEQIQSLFECDEEFQALSLDYFLCMRSLDELDRTIKKFQMRLRDYVELKRVLEEGMLQYVNQMKFTETDSSGPGPFNTSSLDQK